MIREIQSNEPRLRGSRLLVVEDDAVMRATLSRCLRREGASVSEAEDGVQGLVSLGSAAYDLVISDIHMPKMNGLEFLREAKKKYQVPILMMTGEAKSVLEVLEMKKQAVGLVRKPMSLAAFIETVSLHLGAPVQVEPEARIWINVVWSVWYVGLALYLHFFKTAFSGSFAAIAILGPVALRLSARFVADRFL